MFPQAQFPLRGSLSIVLATLLIINCNLFRTVVSAPNTRNNDDPSTPVASSSANLAQDAPAPPSRYTYKWSDPKGDLEVGQLHYPCYLELKGTSPQELSATLIFRLSSSHIVYVEDPVGSNQHYVKPHYHLTIDQDKEPQEGMFTTILRKAMLAFPKKIKANIDRVGLTMSGEMVDRLLTAIPDNTTYGEIAGEHDLYWMNFPKTLGSKGVED